MVCDGQTGSSFIVLSSQKERKKHLGLQILGLIVECLLLQWKMTRGLNKPTVASHATETSSVSQQEARNQKNKAKVFRWLAPVARRMAGHRGNKRPRLFLRLQKAPQSVIGVWKVCVSVRVSPAEGLVGSLQLVLAS